ncbi:MAG: hypothetical protein R3308_02410 [Thiohalobacterales bacterium]|nr:hypothetical protein [Thiohalobacterales bacterium]
MNAKTISSAVIAAILGFSLGLPATALADDGHRKYNRGHGHHDRYDSRHHKRHYKRHKKHRYDKHHYGHRGYGRHYYYDDDDDEDLLIGLVVGGILGYAINSAQHRDDYSYDRNSYSQEVYTPPPAYSGSCLQEREYQTTVIVGGREVDAYGTACLQPDGSWKRSPPRVASY